MTIRRRTRSRLHYWLWPSKPSPAVAASCPAKRLASGRSADKECLSACAGACPQAASPTQLPGQPEAPGYAPLGLGPDAQREAVAGQVCPASELAEGFPKGRRALLRQWRSVAGVSRLGNSCSVPGWSICQEMMKAKPPNRSPEGRLQVVLPVLRGEGSAAEQARRAGKAEQMAHNRKRAFMGAGRAAVRPRAVGGVRRLGRGRQPATSSRMPPRAKGGSARLSGSLHGLLPAVLSQR